MHLTVLSNSFLFHDFDDGCLKALSKTMHRHHHLPGHQILHEGDDIDSVHLVRRGKIDIMMYNEPRGRISMFTHHASITDFIILYRGINQSTYLVIQSTSVLSECCSLIGCATHFLFCNTGICEWRSSVPLLIK